MVEHTPTNQNSDSKNSKIGLVEATAWNATQQRPQAATMLKPVSTNRLIFDVKNENFELFEDLFHKMIKMQAERIEYKKTNKFHAHLQKTSIPNTQ